MLFSNRFRVVLRGTAFITLLCAGISQLSAQTPAPTQKFTYLIRGLKYSPYDMARLDLQFDRSAIRGSLRPLLGDTTLPVSIVGSNETEGTLRLTFNFRSGAETHEFKKANNEIYIKWVSTNNIDNESAVEFRRPKAGAFSEAALTIYQPNCGPQYGQMEIKFAATKKPAALKAFLRSVPDLSSMLVKAYAKTNFRASLGEVLQKSPKKNYWVVDVPVGTEVYIAQKLRPESAIFEMVNLYRGECGGAESSYFVVDKSFLFSGNLISQKKFEQYIDERLPEFTSTDHEGKKWKFNLAQRRVSVVNVPTKPINYRVRLYVAAEISRQKSGFWDSFFVNFRPTALETTTTNDYAVVVEVERSKTVKRSAGSDAPPDDTYFKTELREEDEAEITTAVSSFFAKHDHGWCFYDNEGYEKEIHKSKCDRDTLSMNR